MDMDMDMNTHSLSLVRGGITTHANGADPTKRLITPAFLEALHKIEQLGIVENLDLSRHSRWKVGGIADCVVEPTSTDTLRRVLALAHRHAIPVTVIGLTTNLLFAQEGVRALMIHLGAKFAAMAISGDRVWGQAGAWVPRFARSAAQAGLTGIEHLAGIPGTLGGLICMNGGSQRKGIGDQLVSVTAVDLLGHTITYSREDCGFAYRTSIFQSNRQIITEAVFEYEVAKNKSEVRRQMKRILEDRRRKFPQKLPNCGSVFVSNPAMYDSYGPPGAVIEKCGLKGTIKGGAEISRLHANFIVNTGGATTSDVLYLINLARTRVQQETGYDMEAEAKYVDVYGNFRPAHMAAAEIAKV